MKENISFEFIRFDNKMEANIYYRIPKILFESNVRINGTECSYS